MKKGKDTVDISQLPPVTETITSVLFKFDNNDKKLKIIESFYKMPEKELKMISREEIILFAKDQKIYVDPAEGKKPAKGEPPIEHKPITAQELAKAAKLLIEENSVQYRKNKKDILDNIENLKKQKEESIAYWAAQAEELKKDPKKKPDKKTLPKPEEIIIPEVKEYDLDYLVVLYNYPLTGEEFIEMEKENIILNNIREIVEVADYVPTEEKVEEAADKKAPAAKKPANAPKDAGKPVTDAQILKYFTDPTLLNPEFTPDNVYNNLFKTKMNLGADSKMRNCLFDKDEFAFRVLDDPKKTYFNVYQEEFINSMRELNEFLYLFKKWEEIHEFQEVGTPINDFSLEKIIQFVKNNDFLPKDLEHNSVGNILSSYFKSRTALEEEEKRINAEKELERQKKEEEEKRKKETEMQEEEAKKLEAEKKDKKTSTGKKASIKEASKPEELLSSQVQGSETAQEKSPESEIDTQGVNDINQLFDNFCDDIVKEFDNPPLDENFNMDNEEQKINEETDNINTNNKILEENSNMQSGEVPQSQEAEIGPEEEGEVEEENNNIPNVSNELESHPLSENMKKQAEELLAQENHNIPEQPNENENLNEDKKEEEKKEEKKEENVEENKENNLQENQEVNKEAEQKQEQEKKPEQQILPDTLNQNFDKQNLLKDIENIKQNEENIKEENEQEHEPEQQNENNKEIESQEQENSQNITDNNNIQKPTEEIAPYESNNENKQNELDDNATENLDYERLIINENDEMMKNSLESKNEHNYLFNFEKSLNKSRAIPGIFRPPSLFPMEEHLRKAIRAKVYPFLPQEISIPMYEKYNLIHKFEECMKEQIPERDFDFSNRIYQENLTQDIITQRIAKLLLLSPEVKTYYNENTDNMLLMLYFNIPKERVFRKYNKYRYLNKPDFDNWIKYFKPVFELKKAKDKLDEEKKEESKEQEGAAQNPNSSQVVPTQEKEKEANPQAENNVSSHIKEESLHEGPQESMIKGDKKAVNPYLKLFQPLGDVFSDPMYVSSDTFIGVVKEKIKYMFPSDNGLFIKKILENGIFSSYSSFVVKDEMIFGIRKDQSKNTEFWYRYDTEGTALSISKNEEGKIYTNFTYVNGLNLQILPNGEITQKLEGSNNYRVITSKASIIEYNTDEIDKEKKWMNIYYSNGNYSEIKDGKIRSINNKGYQTEKDLTTGEINVLSQIPVTVQLDIESQTNTMIREDGVIQIKYLDNSCLTIHKDTTKIFTEVPDENNNFKYMIEHDKYCTINVYTAGESRVFGDNYDEIVKDLSLKSKDGIIYEIVSPDKNKIYVFKDTSDNVIILIKNANGSIIKVEPNK